jgi:hypothetical protein
MNKGNCMSLIRTFPLDVYNESKVRTSKGTHVDGTPDPIIDRPIFAGQTGDEAEVNIWTFMLANLSGAFGIAPLTEHQLRQGPSSYPPTLYNEITQAGENSDIYCNGINLTLFFNLLLDSKASEKAGILLPTENGQPRRLKLRRRGSGKSITSIQAYDFPKEAVKKEKEEKKEEEKSVVIEDQAASYTHAMTYALIDLMEPISSELKNSKAQAIVNKLK